MRERALGCVNSPLQPEEARRRDSRNLGPILSPSPVGFVVPECWLLLSELRVHATSYNHRLARSVFSWTLVNYQCGPRDTTHGDRAEFQRVIISRREQVISKRIVQKSAWRLAHRIRTDYELWPTNVDFHLGKRKIDEVEN